MSLYYFDASALVKYYVIEPGSGLGRSLTDSTWIPGSGLTRYPFRFDKPPMILYN
jgi:hypothetical protein